MVSVRDRARRGFTLIELLVVITIIAILIALLLPAVQAIRQAAATNQCANNLKQIALAMANHESAKRGLPPRRYAPGWGNKPNHGWGSIILPYVEQQSVANVFKHEYDFYDKVNEPALLTPLSIFLCPAAGGPRTITLTRAASAPSMNPDKGSSMTTSGAAGDYFGINSVILGNNPDGTPIWPHTQNNRQAMNDGTICRISEISDGASNTWLVSEQAGRPNWYVRRARQSANTGLSQPEWWGMWASYNVHSYWPYTVDGLIGAGTQPSLGSALSCSINCNNSQGVYGFHPNGVNTVFVDGAVHFISADVVPRTLAQLMTRDDAEILGDYGR